MIRTLIISIAAALVSLVPFSVSAEINDVYVIHFVLDGLNWDAFENTLKKSRLPTIEKKFIQEGAFFPSAISSFPSTSTTVYQSYVTGLLPGHSGIPHLERFDRQTQKVIGYLTVGGYKKLSSDLFNFRALINPDVQEFEPTTTIFEFLKGHPTAALYSSFYRGASLVHPRTAPARALWSTFVTHREERVNLLAMNKTMDLFKDDIEKIPRYSLVGLYSTDIMGHKYGPQSFEVEEVLVQFDLFLKEFLNVLDSRGIADKTYIVLSSDHGMHASSELFPFQKTLEKNSVSVKPKNPRVKNYTLYAANRGVVSSHIYVRHNGGFAPIESLDVLRKQKTAGGKPIDLIDLMTKLEVTDLLIVRNGAKKTAVFDRTGNRADISCYTLNSTDYCSYTLAEKNKDPLDFSQKPELEKLLDSAPHSALAWLKASAGEKYPDAVIELSQIFDDGRAGDAFITTRDRWGFRKVKAGNHGGALAADMRTPLLIRGPTVPRGKFDAARPADIYPLLLKWFGIQTPEANRDGVDPFNAPYNEDAGWQQLARIEKLVDEGKDIRGLMNELRRAPLNKLAKEEAVRRARIVQKLDTLKKALESQESDKEALRIADPIYLKDHLAIVERTRRWAVAAAERMKIIANLNALRWPSSGASPTSPPLKIRGGWEGL